MRFWRAGVAICALMSAAACDQASDWLPTTTEQPSAPAGEPTPASGEQPSSEPAPTPTTTPTSSDTAANTQTSAGASGSDAAPSAPTADSPVTPPPVPPVTYANLSEMNAAPCGPLPAGAATIASLAGAERDDNAEAPVTAQLVLGMPGTFADLPGIVKLEPQKREGTSVSRGHCGATRIADRWFLTASHCIEPDKTELVLLTGSTTLNSPKTNKITAAYAVCHAAYNATGQYDNDIALLRAPDDADIGDVAIVAVGGLTKPFNPKNYPEARIGGWGLVNYAQGKLSNELLTTTVDIADIGPAQIQLNSRGGSGPCIGDSGGPLFVQDDGQSKLAGVLSTVQATRDGKVCEGDYRARYTNVLGFTDWVATVTAACDRQPGLCGVKK